MEGNVSLSIRSRPAESDRMDRNGVVPCSREASGVFLQREKSEKGETASIVPVHIQQYYDCSIGIDVKSNYEKM